MENKVSERIMDIFNNKFLDDDFENVKIKYEIKRLLYNYQHLHVFNLVTAIKNNNIAIDGSATGTGKTYTSIAVCKQLNLDPIIICAKSTRSNWKLVCNKFKVNPICIVNYELIRNCKIYDSDGNKKDSEFVFKNEKKKFCWEVEKPKKTIIIYDEAHKCKNNKSQLGKLFVSSKHQCKILMLSATLCDKLDDFAVFGYMLGLYNKVLLGRNWIKGILRNDTKRIGSHKYSSLSDSLFPDKGSRMMLEDIGSDFPKNQIIANCYDIDEKDIEVMNSKLNKLKKYYGTKDKLVEISDARQEIEKLKIPILLEEIIKYNEMDKSVVVFVNFINTIDTISTELYKMGINHSIVKGGQSEDERDINIELFQYNRNEIILCTIQTGGESINLHDKNGDHPRVSIISPSLSSIELTQALGRIYRSDTKSQCLQKIIFCADTYEEKVCEIIKNKSTFINKLSDDDLIAF